MQPLGSSSVEAELTNTHPQISFVPADRVDTVWDFVSGYVQQAIEHSMGELQLSDIRAMLSVGALQLWVVTEGMHISAAIVTELKCFTTLKICNILLLGGQGLERWVQLIGDIEAWALSNGADTVTCFSRKGFIPILKEFGYGQQYVVLSKKLGKRIH